VPTRRYGLCYPWGPSLSDISRRRRRLLGIPEVLAGSGPARSEVESESVMMPFGSLDPGPPQVRGGPDRVLADGADEEHRARAEQ
jgi:hypothetical protein